MGELVKFEVGCRCCAHLVQVGKKSYMCDTRVHMDDSTVMPIENGLHTSDWNICDGEYYTKASKGYAKLS